MRFAPTALTAPVWLSLLAMVAASASAQHEHEHSPYARTQSAEVASLSEEEVRALRNGEGMGLARAAELNHFLGRSTSSSWHRRSDSATRRSRASRRFTRR